MHSTPRLPSLSLTALAAAVGLSACAPTPVFDDDIGVAAIPIAAGEAAGTFALKVVNTTLVKTPFGDEAGGGTNYRLVKRTFNADENVYEQSSTLCGGFNVAVLGVTTDLPESTYRAVPESSVERVAIDDAGLYQQTDHIQLWGIKDLPDPFETALPKDKVEALEEPHAARIYDMDNDDVAGVTSIVSGAVNGEVYVIQRKTVTTSGVVLGPDRAIGLAVNTNELVQLGNSDPVIFDRQTEGSSGPHPDPKRSWFAEERIDDDSDCDFVMGAEAAGILPVLAPFPASTTD